MTQHLCFSLKNRSMKSPQIGVSSGDYQTAIIGSSPNPPGNDKGPPFFLQLCLGNTSPYITLPLGPGTVRRMGLVLPQLPGSLGLSSLRQ